jgi:alanine racemase
MRNTATAIVNIKALRSNLAVVRALCPSARLMAVVKANAYGHGLIEVAHAFADADGLAVARLTEAERLRKAGIENRLLLLATLLDESDVRWCSQHDVDVVVHDPRSAGLVAQLARTLPLRAWLKVDSGMRRAGLTVAEFEEADARLRRTAGVIEIVHMTHFSGADESDPASMEAQLNVFQAAHPSRPSVARSIMNSAALLRNKERDGNWVRPGVLLYGCNPLPDNPVVVEPAMTLVSRVIAIRAVPRGASVGYASAWTAERPSRIATIGIGYGDGYPRHARTGTPILVNGEAAPLVGRVSMDSLAVDVTGLSKAEVGDEAVLWGPQLPPTVVAGCAGTISYELLTSVSARVERVYV